MENIRSKSILYWKPKWSVWSIWTYSTGRIFKFRIQKVSFGRKSKNIVFQKHENPVLRFQSLHFLESVAKSDPPDPPIRSVSWRQYRRIPRGLKLITFFGQKSMFLLKIGKIGQIPSLPIALGGFYIEVRDSPHGIFGSCTRDPRALTRWAELLGRRRRRRRRRRRQLVSPGGYRPPDPPPCLISKGAGLQNVRFHTRMLDPSVYPPYLARKRVLFWLGPIPECLVLEYFQIHESYQNAWSFSISRFSGHTRMLGPPVFPDSQVENPVLRFQNIYMFWNL